MNAIAHLIPTYKGQTSPGWRLSPWSLFFPRPNAYGRQTIFSKRKNLAARGPFSEYEPCDGFNVLLSPGPRHPFPQTLPSDGVRLPPESLSHVPDFSSAFFAMFALYGYSCWDVDEPASFHLVHFPPLVSGRYLPLTHRWFGSTIHVLCKYEPAPFFHRLSFCARTNDDHGRRLLRDGPCHPISLSCHRAGIRDSIIK